MGPWGRAAVGQLPEEIRVRETGRGRTGTREGVREGVREGGGVGERRT